ncbi:MAG: GNAT family N-acetyltransferase [Alphaproteobacteria bacterium]|nr:GNAT family N-acetyltransferase [Alphaproteobacteria bacterium]
MSPAGSTPDVRIRLAGPVDAAVIIALLDRIHGETPFMLYEPGELNVSAEVYAARISESMGKARWFMLLAEDGGAPVGFINGFRGGARRTAHVLGIGLGILRSHWGRGIGRSLLAAAEDLARRQGISRLELSVQPTNRRAIALYEKLGYRHEGTKRNGQLIDSRFVDEHLMAKLLADDGPSPATAGASPAPAPGR